MMPTMDGFAVLERLSADPALRSLPVVVLTAMTLTPADEQRLMRGAELVLKKSTVTSEALLEELKRIVTSDLLRNKRRMSGDFS